VSSTSTTDTGLLAALSGRFHIARELGRGGRGMVCLAHDTSLDRDVAIKVLSHYVSSALGVERFTREIRLRVRLVDPNIVPLFDSGRLPALAVAEVLRIVADVAEPLGVLMDLPYDRHGLAADPRYARLLRTAGSGELLAQ
jgi:hypothetical protein